MIYRFSNFELDHSVRELCSDGVVVETEPIAFDSLAFLVIHRNPTVSKDELLRAVWPRQIEAETALTQEDKARGRKNLQRLREITGESWSGDDNDLLAAALD